MNLWHLILLACAAGIGIKLIGFLVPATVLERPAVSRTADLMTVGLLAALVAIQAFTSGASLVVDARLPAIVVAAVLLALRVPFLLVVIVAAGVAAGLRLAGWMA